MHPEYVSYTNYKDIEDINRLIFIVKSIEGINKKEIKILDIGCGNGNISLALGSLGFAVTGVDIDKTSVENAVKRNKFSNVQFQILDANTFNLNAQFDAVVCSEVLEHLEQPSELLKSIFQIIKPGGILVATVPNGWGPREILVTRPMQWLAHNNWDSPLLLLKKLLGYPNATKQSSNPELSHIQFYSVSSIKKTIGNAGFQLQQFKNADFIERVFPYSFLTRRIKVLQKIDCWFARFVPHQLTSGFYTSWEKPLK